MSGTGGFDGKRFAKNLPNRPGVYRMLDADGQLLYVGKASSLKNRVGSYFVRPTPGHRIGMMLHKVASIEVTVTRSEGEALLLENELVKSGRPRYNVLLRDDKSFPYIHLSAGEDYPRMGFHRGARSGRGRYFGPFPDAGAVRTSLNAMQKLFRVRQCEDSVFRNRSRPCLQYQIGRCSAPCVGLVAVDDYARDVRHASMFLDGRRTDVLEELAGAMEAASAALAFEQAALIRDRIAALKHTQAKQFVVDVEEDADVIGVAVGRGQASVHVMTFRNGMSLGGRSFHPRLGDGEETAAEVLSAFIAQYYDERPAPPLVLLDQAIADQELLTAALTERVGRKVELRVPQRGNAVRLVESARRNAEIAGTQRSASREHQQQRVAALTELLELPAAPQRIECFDISHTQGEATVASCVVFDAEGPVKAQYRRFNIGGITAGDDYAAMAQALERRFRRGLEEGGELPDLLLIDGGRGQVAQAARALAELGVEEGVQIVGVAKGETRRAGLETLVLAGSGREIVADPGHPGLHLIQAVRDEAHRFAIRGHRARREKAREKSRLEDIEGVGPRRRQQLIRHFGGIAGVLRAGVEELSLVPGIHRELATRIYDALH